MSTEQPAAQARNGWTTPIFKSQLDWVLLAGLLGIGPLLWVHSQNLSKREHFQFFPIAWGLFCVLIYMRGKTGPVSSTVRRVIGGGCLAIAVFIAAYGLYLLSPWLSHVALMFITFGWLLLRLGATPWHEIVAWMSLLAITLPLPMNGDTLLVQQLQSWSTQSASSVLDLTSTPHLRRANVLEIRTGELFVDEACSGVDSLYSLAAIALMLVIWQQRSFLVSLITLSTVPMWAWLGNLIRISTIALLLDRFGIDLTHGWPHTLLGLTVFASSFIFLLLTQAAFSGLLMTFPSRAIGSNQIHLMYNRLVNWPSASSYRSKKAPLSVEASQTPTKSLKVAVGTACTAFGLIGCASALLLTGNGPWQITPVRLAAISKENIKEVFNQAVLPANFEGMQVVGFSTSHRETGSFFGEHSVAWHMKNGTQIVQASLDFPFGTFHTLEECYRLSGQQVVDSQTTKSLEEDLPLEISEISLADQLQSESFLCYVNFTEDGEAVTTLSSSFTRGAAANSTVYQAQLYIADSGTLTKEQRARYGKILVAFVRTVLPFVKQLEKH
jgi:exosortase